MRALILDIDGVMLEDDRALPGTPELVDWLLRSAHPFLFLTNYSSQTPADLANRMQAAGLKIPLDHFYTSAMATAEFLDHQAGDRRRAYNFDMIQRAAQLVLQGARFVATNPDVAGPLGRPSCGAFAAPIERITGKRPFYVGKPSAFMMRAALRHLQAHSEEAWMVGDNMETDIIAGLQTGLVTVLVLSGVSRREDLTRYAYRPDHIVPDAFALTALLESQGT